MAALQCEVCGGKLIGKPGGVFECDSCGVEYSTEWAKAKVQEIKGTVKIEGPVQVEGTVTVDGGVNLTALLKRGDFALADCEWDKAKEYFDQVLNMDAECGNAYFGLTMAELQCTSREDFAKLYAVNDCAHDKNLQKAKQFPSEAKDFLTRLDEEITAELDMDEEECRQVTARLAPIRERLRPAASLIAAGSHYSVGVRADGVVVSLNTNTTYACVRGSDAFLRNLSDVVAVEAETDHIVALRADGTVAATGLNGAKQCEVSEWKDIVAISAGGGHTAGLKADGTVLSTGCYNDNWEYSSTISGWRNVVAIAAGDGYVVALKSDGTVVAAGNNKHGQCDVSEWENIVAISAGSLHTVGLKADGAVVATGNNRSGQCNVSRWRNIVAVAAGGVHTVGLKADGTVVAAGHDSNRRGECNGERTVLMKRGIVAISAGSMHTLLLTDAGTVDSFSTYSIGDLSGWKLFDSLESLVQIRAEATARRKAEIEVERRRKEKNAEQQRLEEELRLEAERQEAERLCLEAERREEERRRVEAERQKKISELKSEHADLQIELANLKGLFSGGKRRQLETRLAEIEEELKKL